MDDIPQWLKDDPHLRRREQRSKTGGRIKLFFSTLVLIGILAGFVWFLFWLYGYVQSKVEPIVYVAPQRAALTVQKPSGESVEAVITAYTSSVDETDDTPFITASGSTTRHGVLACPPKYDFGTRVVIAGKHFVCEDRMNPRYWDDERFDIWVETKEDAFEWGIRTLQVKVLAQR